jgi:ribosomal protein S18 acetylase RimI-like enzyme
MTGSEAIERISRNCFRSFAGFPGAELIDDGRIFGVMSRVPIPFFSGIASTNLAADEVEEVIDLFRAKGCPFRWWITPSTQPRGLDAILEAKGMHHAYDAPGMAADLTTVRLDVPLPAGVTIRRLRDANELTPWIQVFVRAFSRPEAEGKVWRDAYALCGFGDAAAWTHFVAFLDGEAVATTSILLDDGLAGIYFVATLPEARGRGIGAAVTRAAMQFARDRGATQAALQASELGYGVYRSLGFVEHCQLRLYDWQ